MIVPALLTDSITELERMLSVCAGFCGYVQLDFMDGEFVPSRSVSLGEIKGLKLPVPAEAHIMVKRPIDWLKSLKEIGCRRVIYHYESCPDYAEHAGVIREIKKYGLEAGLAINPGTPLQALEPLVLSVDAVLFMSVNPGFYGASFIPEVLGKIKIFKEKYPGKITGIDGGVKEGNLRPVKNSGVDFACVGSAVLKAPDPAEAYKKLSGIFNE